MENNDFSDNDNNPQETVITDDTVRQNNLKKMFTFIGAVALLSVSALFFYFVSASFPEKLFLPITLLPIVLCCTLSLIVYIKNDKNAYSSELCSILWCGGIVIALISIYGLNRGSYSLSAIYENQYQYAAIILAAFSFVASLLFNGVVPLFGYYMGIMVAAATVFQSEYIILAAPASLFCMIPGFILTWIKYSYEDTYRRKMSIIITVASVALCIVLPFMFLGDCTIAVLLIASIIITVSAYVKIKDSLSNPDVLKSSKIKFKPLKTTAAALLSAVQIVCLIYCVNNINEFRYELFSTSMLEVEKNEIVNRTYADIYVKTEDEAESKKYAVIKKFNYDEDALTSAKNCDGNVLYFSNTAPLSAKVGYMDSKYFNGEKISYENIDRRFSDNIPEDIINSGTFTSKDWQYAAIKVYVTQGSASSSMVVISGNSELEKYFCETEDWYY